jgi:ATP-dependent Lon protease
VGGIREKALAARRLGLKTFVLPALNAPDLKELPNELKTEMAFIPVKTLEEVLKVALPAVPAPIEVPAPAPEAQPQTA